MALTGQAAMRAIFLDKDGTLVEDVPYNADPARVTLCSGAVEGLRLLQSQGYALVVVTNQPGIARGMFDDEALARMRDHIASLLAAHGIVLHGFYHCPHSADGVVPRFSTLCMCRKPMPGLLLRAARELGIDRMRSWMIGDILNDVEAGRRAGCKTVLLDNGNETEWEWSALRSPDVIAGDLLAAAKAILRSENGSPDAGAFESNEALHPSRP
jgi:D-glycero-D-manno-heptose 1,7-bisphosphate phosphatase